MFFSTHCGHIAGKFFGSGVALGSKRPCLGGGYPLRRPLPDTSPFVPDDKEKEREDKFGLECSPAVFVSNRSPEAVYSAL